MTRRIERKSFPLIRAALILFTALLVIYIPLKIYIARSGMPDDTPVGEQRLSIFITSELKGYREPCG